MDANNASYIFAIDLRTLLDSVIPLFMFTDSKRLSDAALNGKRTTEKRLLIDISAVGQSNVRFEIGSIGIVKNYNNPDDYLSRIKGNESLYQLIVSCVDNSSVKQWIPKSTAI